MPGGRCRSEHANLSSFVHTVGAKAQGHLAAVSSKHEHLRVLDATALDAACSSLWPMASVHATTAARNCKCSVRLGVGRRA